MLAVEGGRALVAEPALEDGNCWTIMSTRPVAVPKMRVQASFSSGFTSLRKADGLSCTPNVPSISFTPASCSPRTCARPISFNHRLHACKLSPMHSFSSCDYGQGSLTGHASLLPIRLQCCFFFMARRSRKPYMVVQAEAAECILIISLHCAPSKVMPHTTQSQACGADLGVDLIQGLQDELNKAALAAALGRLLAEGAGLCMIVQVAPEAACEFGRIHVHAVHIAVQLAEGVQREGPARLRAAEAHIPPCWAHLRAHACVSSCSHRSNVCTQIKCNVWTLIALWAVVLAAGHAMAAREI